MKDDRAGTNKTICKGLKHIIEPTNRWNMMEPKTSFKQHPPSTAEATGIAAADVAGGNDQKPLLSAGHEQMEAAMEGGDPNGISP